jgi:hypothetical protein
MRDEDKDEKLARKCASTKSNKLGVHVFNNVQLGDNVNF